MGRLTRDERADARWWARYLARWLIVLVALVFVLGAIGLAYSRYIGRKQLDIDAGNRRASYERQDTDRDLLARKISDYYDATTDAHRAALTDEICRIADEVRGGDLTPTQSDFVGANCR